MFCRLVSRIPEIPLKLIRPLFTKKILRKDKTFSHILVVVVVVCTQAIKQKMSKKFSPKLLQQQQEKKNILKNNCSQLQIHLLEAVKQHFYLLVFNPRIENETNFRYIGTVLCKSAKLYKAKHLSIVPFEGNYLQ